MKRLVEIYNLICALIYVILTFVFLKYVNNELKYIVSFNTMYVLWAIFQFALYENMSIQEKVKASYYVGMLFFNVISIVFIADSFMYIKTNMMNILLILYVIIQDIVMYLLYRKEINNKYGQV